MYLPYVNNPCPPSPVAFQQELDELLRGTCAGDRLLVECPATEVRSRPVETEWQDVWRMKLNETNMVVNHPLEINGLVQNPFLDGIFPYKPSILGHTD